MTTHQRAREVPCHVCGASVVQQIAVHESMGNHDPVIDVMFIQTRPNGHTTDDQAAAQT